MMANIRYIPIFSAPSALPNFERLLGIGSRYGAQPSPNDLAQAFIISEELIDGDACTLVLDMEQHLLAIPKKHLHATAFGYHA